MYSDTCFSFSWSRKHMCASFMLRSIEDWWKPLRDILILFRRGMCKLYEPQEFPRASEESIHSMQYESTSALLLEITFRIIWTRVCFFPNRQICSWSFLETKPLQKKTETTAFPPHLWRQIFYKERAVGPKTPMANFKQISTMPRWWTAHGVSSNAQAPHSAGFPEDEASISGGFFLVEQKWGKTENRVSYLKRKNPCQNSSWLSGNHSNHIGFEKKPFILRSTQYNMHWITDFYCQMRISTSNGWDLPQSLFVSDLDSSQCDPTNAGRNCVFSRLWKATKGCADYVCNVCMSCVIIHAKLYLSSSHIMLYIQML